MSSWDVFPPGSEAETDPETSTPAGLLDALDAQAAQLIDVATGGSRIVDVDARYKRRRRLLNGALRARGAPIPFPFEDLWAWRGYWQAQELSTWQSRRQRVAELVRPARDAVEALMAGVQVSDPGADGLPTWARLDQRVAGIITELSSAQNKDDLQDVGRRCREVLIDAAKLLADPDMLPAGVKQPKAADAKGWLDVFLAVRAPGGSKGELRAVIPVAWDLAQKVTHGDIGRVDAYAAAQATVLIVRVLQQLAP